MEDATITVTVSVCRWEGRNAMNEVTREISVTSDEPGALAASALGIGSAVMQATCAATAEYLENLKSAEAEQAEATNE